MNVLPSVLIGSAGALSLVTLLLLFTGDLLTMAATAAAAILLAALAIPKLDQPQEDESLLPLDG
jgi:hypothetical protein